MKGLRGTRIESERIIMVPVMKPGSLTETKWGPYPIKFYRCQIWEHDLIFQQKLRRVFWLPGKIIHHLQNEAEVKAYLYALAPEYDDVKLDFEGEL